MVNFNFLKKKITRLAFLAISAVLTGICVCYPDIGILQWVSLVPAVLVLLSIVDTDKNRLRSVYLYGFFFSMCYFVTVWHWFYVMYPLEFAGLDPQTAVLVILAATLGIPLVQSSTFAFTFVLFCKLARGNFASKFLVIRPLTLGALWGIFEWTQTLFWFGVPWGRLAIGQSSLLVTMQSASLLGPYFVTFIIVAVNALAACAIYYVSARKLCAITCASVFSLNFIFGAVAMVQKSNDDSVRVAAIQGNISSTEKWVPGASEKSFATYERLTKEAAEQGAQIVVWPESVILVYSGSIESRLSNMAKENGIVLIVGALANVEGADGEVKYGNSMITFFPDGSISESVYLKRHLVPFGEYMPWRDFLMAVLPMLGEIGMLDRDLDQGTEPCIVETEFGNVGALICFDSIYETLALESASENAELIVIGTNDSWFFDSRGVYMHENQAKLRAVETGKYVVRAANTGISAIITPDGRTQNELEPLVEGYVMGEVRFVGEKTVYTYVGNLWVWLSVGFVVALLAADTTVKIIAKKRK